MALIQLAMFFVTALSLLLPTGNAQSSYLLLKDVRTSGALTFVPYDDTQKADALQQVKTLLDVWVNNRLKLAYYKNNITNPFPRLARVTANMANLTTDQIHLTLSDVFNNLRDGHTNYNMPGPYRCFTAHTGLFYTFADANTSIAMNPKVVVSGYTAQLGIWNLLKDQLSKVSIGDELVSFNNMTFMQYYAANVWAAGGANTFGGMRSVLTFMTAISGMSNRLPAKDNVTVVLKSVSTGQQYSLDIPYVAVRSDACWSVSSFVYAQTTGKSLIMDKINSTMAASGVKTDANGATLPVFPNQRIDPLKYPQAIKLTPIMDLELEALSQQGSARITGSVTMNPTAISSIFWGIYQPQGKNLGIIRLDDFTPRDASGNPNDNMALKVLRGLLTNELKDTNALVIDLRSNGGGSINYANSIPQLFKPDFRQMGAMYLRNDINKRIFVDKADPTDSFRLAYEMSNSTDYYTRQGYYATFDFVNQFGQAYLKPVGLFTDGNCFSACDLLSSNFGNAGIGVIFGEDGQTGGGGANVFEHKDMVGYDSTDFQSVPLYNEMTDPTTGFSYALGMRVGIRATIRNGLHNNQVIEDYGAKTDVVVRPQVTDLMFDAKSSSQFDRIADKLALYGTMTKTNELYFVLEPQTLVVPSGPMNLTAEVAGLDNLIVRDINGRQLAMTTITNATTKQNVTVQAQPAIGLGNTMIYIMSTQGNNSMLKTVRNLRVIPQTTDMYDLATNNTFNWDLMPAPFMGVYNNDMFSLKNSSLGWSKRGNVWAIGQSGNYSANLDTDMSFFFKGTVGKSIQVTVKASYDTENTYDIFQVNFFNAVTTVPLLTSVAFTSNGAMNITGVTGKGVLNQTLSYKLTTPLFGISLRFTSDFNTNAPGVTVSDVIVSMAA